jgi:hypothetical protein
MALGSNQHVTEMNGRNLPVGKVWLAGKADNVVSICEPII